MIQAFCLHFDRLSVTKPQKLQTNSLSLQKTVTMHDFIFDKNFDQITYDKYELTNKEFENCTFTNCDMTQSFFTGTTFVDCTFKNCNFKDAKIGHVGLRNVLFIECNFTSVNFAMTDQVIYEFHFTNCLLDYAQFYKLKLKGMQFTNCSMVSVDFMESDLTEALFDNCNLRLAVFSDTNLTKADFYTSHNFSINPEKNKLKKAIFSNENVKGLLDKYEVIIR